MKQANLTFYVSKNHPDYKIAREHAAQTRRLYNTLNKIKIEKSNKHSDPTTQTPVTNQLGLNLTDTTETWRKTITIALSITLPTKTAQSTVRKIDSIWKRVIKDRSHGKKTSNPKYKNKFAEVQYNTQAISRKRGLNKVIPSGWKQGFTLPNDLTIERVQSAILVPTPDGFELKVLYYKEEKPPNKIGNNIAGGDLGVNNLLTIVIPGERPKLVDGKGVKSLNRYFNKEVGKLQSKKEKAKGGEKTKIQKVINRLWYKRDKQVNHYLNSASNEIVRLLQQKDVQELVIGWSEGFKTEVSIGKHNNQSFVQLPHARFRDMLVRKCGEVGVRVTIQEESYTSKASCVDNDDLPVFSEENREKHKFSGRRVSRGIYKSKTGILVHADVNGAWNILRKCKPSIGWSSGEVAFPERLKFAF